jgi:hypothetical protein
LPDTAIIAATANSFCSPDAMVAMAIADDYAQWKWFCRAFMGKGLRPKIRRFIKRLMRRAA